MSYRLDGKRLRQGRPFEHNGMQYPANWLQLSTQEDKDALGVTWVEDEQPTPFDSKFYSAPGVEKDLQEVKVDLGKEYDNRAYNLLSPTDWYVVRKSETNEAIPVGITSFRTRVREVSNSRKSAVSGQPNIETLVCISTFPDLQWPSLDDYT